MNVFIQSSNPITGCSTWVEADPDYDHHQEVARSAFADMLHDRERNHKYYVALRKAIEKKHKVGHEAHVLDIGTGTGLLSMMAAKCGANTVTACEAFKPMADCAKTIIRENGFGSQIKLVKKKSTEMTVGENGDMKHRANILVTEVFDTELIGEGALLTFKHAHDILLEENSIVIPNRATVWAQIVESNIVRSWNKINIIEDPKNGKELMKPPCSVNACCGSSAVHDIQLSQLPQDAFKSLLHPQPIFKFDWSGKTLDFNECNTLHGDAIASGTAHAIFMWWELIMDDDQEILLSCAPVWGHPYVKSNLTVSSSLLTTVDMANKIPWRDHWIQAVYYLPEEISITLGEQVTLVGYHDEYSFWFQVKLNYKSAPKSIPSVCTCAMHLAYSRSRIGQLNDKERNEKYINVFRNHIISDTICFSFSDGSLLGLTAAKLGAKKVIIHESNHLSRQTLESFVVANNLTTNVHIVQSIDEISDDIKANLVIGEPYYINSIYPWENLRFWYLASKYAPGIPTIPVSARIRGIAVQFDNLHKIRAPLGMCENFDLTTFDRLLLASSEISDDPVEVHSLWEYPAKSLTSPFDIAYFDFSQRFESKRQEIFSGEVPISEKGSCNGVALWIDWYLDTETIISGGPSRIVETGKYISWEPNTRQGVFLLRNIENVTKNHNVAWLLKYQCGEDQNLDFSFKLNVKT